VAIEGGDGSCVHGPNGVNLTVVGRTKKMKWHRSTSCTACMVSIGSPAWCGLLIK
jgi:hypothetical protein